MLLGATGGVGEVTKVATLGTITAPLVVAVGLGPEPTGALPVAETLRRATAAAVRALAGSGTVALALPVGDDAEGGTDDALRGIVEGALLGGYRFAGYKSKPTPAGREPVTAVLVHVPDAASATAAAEIERAAIVGAAVARTRDWVNTAPNELRPPAFAEQAAALAVGGRPRRRGARREGSCGPGGYGGIIAVGQGSEAPPRLVRIAYTPAGAPRKKVALVGKGITFDTGGVLDQAGRRACGR